MMGDEPMVAALDALSAAGMFTGTQVTSKLNGTGRTEFALIVGRWQAIDKQGQVVALRPIELAAARGVGECQHCERECRSYCRSCRAGVCLGDWQTHERDHAERRALVTKTGA